MSKEFVYNILRENSISFDAVDHPPAFTVEDILSFDLPHPEYGAKNLFLRDAKKKNYYLLTVRDEMRVQLKIFQERAGTARLSFASAEDLGRILKLTPGSVSPFGILNDEERMVHVYIDDYFKDSVICIHPNDNTASVYLQCGDLMRLLKDHGNEVSWISLE